MMVNNKLLILQTSIVFLPIIDLDCGMIGDSILTELTHIYK